MKRTLHNHGFTIVELMISTIIFSTILVICSSAVIQISKTYYKGYINSRTQEAARGIIDEVSRSIQFSGGNTSLNTVPVGGISHTYFCVDSTRYTFVLGRKVTNNTTPTATETKNALISESVPISCPPQTASIVSGNSGQRQYVPLNMRLASLIICVPGPTTADCPNPPPASTSLYQIKLRLVYGEDDLLCSSTANDCNNNINNFVTYTSAGSIPKDLSCKGKSGSQFCAVSELSTTVVKRL